VKRAFSFSVQFCVIWGVVIAITFGVAAPSLTSLFTNKPEVVSIVSTYMIIVPISYAAVGMILISCSTFAALGRPFPAVVLTITNMLILYLPLAALGSRFFGLNGIFAATCGVNVIIGLSAIAWNRRTLQLMAARKLAPISGTNEHLPSNGLL
jgi:Na+-driven multidrug efflux pump